MPISTIRHREVVASIGPGGFTATLDRRAIKTKRLPKAIPARDAAASTKAKLSRMRLDTKAVTATFDRMGDSLDRIANGLRTIAARRQAMQDAAQSCPPSASATAGYVRDSAGNRLRPMTPADMQALHDRYWGRTR